MEEKKVKEKKVKEKKKKKKKKQHLKHIEEITDSLKKSKKNILISTNLEYIN